MSVIQFIDRPAPFALDPAIALLDAPEGAAFDFVSGRAWVRDRTIPANNFLGDVNDLLTYASPSVKYVTNSAGLLVPGTTLRCDHDPATGEPLGILVEGQRTNLLLQSSGFVEAPWTKIAATVEPNSAMSPAGTLTASKLVESVTNAHHYMNATLPITSGVTYRLSIYAKAAERSVINIFTSGNLGGTAIRVDTSTGTIQSGVGIVKSVGAGWWRIELSATAVSTGSSLLYVALYNGAGIYIGDGISGLYVWGAQAETGLFASSYIKTEGSQVTRAADNISIPLSAFPWNGGAGTLTANGAVVPPVVSGSALSISGVCFAEGITHLKTLTWVPA